MGRIKNAKLDEQYEQEREEESRAEQECIQTIGIINEKIDKLQISIMICNKNLNQANIHLSSLLAKNNRMRRSTYKIKKYIVIMGGITSVVGLLYYFKSPR
jgi:hypothetical protein